MIQPTDDPFKCECVHVLDAKGVIRLISIICSSAAFPVAEKKQALRKQEEPSTSKAFRTKKTQLSKDRAGKFLSDRPIIIFSSKHYNHPLC